MKSICFDATLKVSNQTFGRKIKVSNCGIVLNKLWNESMQTSKTRPLMIQKSYFIAFLVIFLFSRSNSPKCFWKNHHSTILSKKTTLFCDFQKSFKYFFDVWFKDFLTKMRQFENLKISVCLSIIGNSNIIVLYKFNKNFIKNLKTNKFNQNIRKYLIFSID